MWMVAILKAAGSANELIVLETSRSKRRVGMSACSSTTPTTSVLREWKALDMVKMMRFEGSPWAGGHLYWEGLE